MSKKKEVWPKQLIGKYCGYTLFEDGSIEVAPNYQERLKDIITQELAIDAILRAVTRECNALLLPLEKQRARFWTDLLNDYELSGDKIWSLDHRTGKLTGKLKELA